jgi:GT2 family glycosyltransferase
LTPTGNAQPEKQPPRVSVAVVSHNRADRLRKCLESLERSEGRERLQLIVVENGSRDASAQVVEEFPNVQLIRLPKNFGLTKGLNLGWRAADAEYVLFLHEDTEVEAGAVARLADALDADATAAAVCPLLVDGDGNPAPQLGSLPPDGEWRIAEPSSQPVAVEYPLGAALMARVFLIKAIRQIDERYGQFGGDADLAAQILRARKKILLIPEARVCHYGGRPAEALVRADFLLGRAVFAGKYLGAVAGLRARLAAIFSPLVRLQLAEVRHTLAGQKIDGTQG